MRFRLGEYFSGPGGMAQGAHDAALDVPGIELEHAWAVDIDEDSCETYRKNIPGASESTVFADDARGALGRLPLDAPDGFAFGFPCNDFSQIGERKGFDGKYGPLYHAGVEVLVTLKPKWFVAENVGGIRSSDQGRAFATILAAMEGAGYTVYPHLYKFEQYGVPQARHRVIIVGLRNDQPVRFRVPAPSIYADEDVTARTALGRPFPPGVANHELPAMSRRVVDRLNLIDPGENAFNARRMTDDLRLNVRGATISQIYKRLLPDAPAYTVTGSGGGGTHVYHWAEPRALTNRERARLQTFDDSFAFLGNRTSVRKQVGMAVPVKGAKAIFAALFRTYAGINYPSIPSNIIAPSSRAQVLEFATPDLRDAAAKAG